MKGIKGMKKKK